MKKRRLRLLVLLGSFLVVGQGHASEKADQVVVDKSERVMTLLRNGQEIGRFPISLGGDPEGPKHQEGDQRTPEGRYVLDYKKSDSAYYKAIHISYPNAEDVAYAEKMKLAPGGQIMIHGQKNGFGWLGVVMQHFDWTAGCIAVTNRDMDRIWEAVEAGTPIEIKP
jgi:murein L,D-transpeptidase YafK